MIVNSSTQTEDFAEKTKLSFFGKLKEGAETLMKKTKRNVDYVAENVKKGAENVKNGVNSALAKITAPVSRGNKRLKKLRKRRKPGRFFPDEVETEEKKKSLFRLARQQVQVSRTNLKINFSGNGTLRQLISYMGYASLFWATIVLISKFQFQYLIFQF